MAQPKFQFNFKIDDDVKAWLDAKAKETRLSRTWLMNNLARQEMQREAKAQ